MFKAAGLQLKNILVPPVGELVNLRSAAVTSTVVKVFAVFIVPLLLGISCLAFGLALATNHRGFRDRLVESPINLAQGDVRVSSTFKTVGVMAIILGIFGTVFGVIFAIFS